MATPSGTMPNPMRTHVQVIAILLVVFGAMGTLGALFMLAAGQFLFGGSPWPGGAFGARAPMYLMLMLWVPLLAALPALIAGIGLLGWNAWARTLAFIPAALSLMWFPVGTAFGVYALWALTRPETEPLFLRAAPTPG